MSDLENQEKSVTEQGEVKEEKITPSRCFTGSAISGGLGFATYLLAKSIVMTYTTMPIEFNNPMAVRIATTVRTLVMGLSIMATFLFGMVAVGLVALGIKLIIEEKKINQA
jgi:Protein of unknown function (DUF3082)